ncbi:Ribonuclease H-like domain containing protein [Naviculisporaceae sp. PSN 640]
MSLNAGNAPRLEEQTVRQNLAALKPKPGAPNQEPAIPNSKFPPRLGLSSTKGSVNLVANCFPIRLKADIKLFFYDVRATKLASPPTQATPQHPDTDTLAANARNLTLADENDQFREAEGPKLGHILYHAFTTVPVLRNLIANGQLASDFRHVLVTTKKLQTTERTFDVEYRGEKSRYHRDWYRVTFNDPENDLEHKVSALDRYLGGTDHAKGEKIRVDQNLEGTIQALNIFLRHGSKTNMLHPFETQKPTQIVVGSKAYNLDVPPTADLTGCVETFRGYFSSIRPAAGRLLVNVNPTYGPFYQRGPLHNILAKLKANRLSLEQWHAFITGIRVVLKYRTEDAVVQGKKLRVIKRIAGFSTPKDGEPPEGDQGATNKASKDAKPSTRDLKPPKWFTGDPKLGAKWDEVGFELVEEGQAPKDITVKAYFEKNHKFTDEDHKINNIYPVVNVGTILRPEYVPVSVCEVVPGQSYRAALEGKQTSNMIKAACLTPDHPKVKADLEARAPQEIGLDTQKIDGQTLASNFKLLAVMGKRLERPIISYGKVVTDQGKVKSETQTVETNWQAKWNLDGRFRYAEPQPRPPWAVLLLTRGPTRNFTAANIGVATLEDKMRIKLGCAEGAEKPRLRLFLTYSHQSHGHAYKNKLVECKNQGVKLVVVWLPDKVSAADYRHLKRISDSEVGIHTVFVAKPHLAGNPGSTGKQYWDNILLKIHLKLQGVNQTVSMPDKYINFDETMVVGMDVTHPSPGSVEVPHSTIGMVASVDKKLGQWPGTIFTQPTERTEIVDEITAMQSLLKPHLKRWKTRHSTFPPQILIYRDGVSEGQYQQVVDHEYRLIKNVCDDLYKEVGQLPPDITIVVVAKRHHMRFYQMAGGYKGNPVPGTLVDRTVTSQFLWEFYLQAQFPLMGTARPAHYVVVVDNIFRKMTDFPANPSNNSPGPNCPADVLYSITHSLSYALGRATTPTSVCAPAFLADKLCDRARMFDPPPNSRRADGTYPAPLRVHPDLENSMFYI